MTRKPTPSQPKRPWRKGFTSMSGLIGGSVRAAGEKRGFAVMRLLTHWTEIVGEETARIVQPIDVRYSRDGFGATLTVLTNGANAPMVQAELPKLRERVNACYGYAAISRVRITQTAPVGFHEGKRSFEHAPPQPRAVPAEVVEASRTVADGVENQDLRQAIEALARNVLARKALKEGSRS